MMFGFSDWWSDCGKLKSLQFLRSLGCNTDSCRLFDSFKDVDSRQGARYIWLLIAMHIAEDEGIMI